MEATMSETETYGSERCPECGRDFEDIADRRGKESPKSDYVYFHDYKMLGGSRSYRDSCYSDDPPGVGSA